MAETTQQHDSETAAASSSVAEQEQDLRERLGVPPAPKRPSAARSSRVMAALKTLLWVAPLTALIWTYAEREQLATHTVHVAVKIVAGSPDRVVTLLSPDDSYLDLDLKAPRASLDSLRDDLAAGRLPPLEVRLNEDQPYGEYEIDLVDRIGRNELLQRRAINVVRARPAVRIKVEPKGVRDVRVIKRPQDRIVGDVEFVPRTIRLEGPAATLDKLKPEQLVVEADLSRFTNRPPKTYEEAVSLIVPKDPGLSISPQQVTAKVHIRESSTKELGSIRVDVRLPAATLAEDTRIIVAPKRLFNVDIAGPPDAIELIDTNAFQPVVILELTPEDLASDGQKTKRLRPQDYWMPKDVVVTNPDQDIKYTVTIVDPRK